MLGTAFSPKSPAGHSLLSQVTNLPKWRAGWNTGEQMAFLLIGCTLLPVSQSKTVCMFSCSKSYLITPLSPNLILTEAGKESLRPRWPRWGLTVHQFLPCSFSTGSSSPKLTNSHKTKQNKTNKRLGHLGDSVECLTSAQVMISQFVSSSPTSESLLLA